MKICAKRYSHRTGFTLVEMLAAIAVIAILISLIIPALNMVRRSADMAKQRAQFHSIEIALEAFRADDGDYPPSDDLGLDTYAYPGAMKLAEAIIGQDGFGFHPKSQFTNTGWIDTDGDGDYDDEALYLPDLDTYIGTLGLTPAEEQAMKEENLNIRERPYLELETANAVRLRDLYKSLGSLGLEEAPVPERFVLCDMFRLVKNSATGKRTGMPILYYKANTSNFNHDPQNYLGQDNIYDFRDNRRMLEELVLWEETLPQPHPMRSTNDGGDPAIFYTNTLNPNFPPPNGRPYRVESFILLSAGPDGLYGTPDDVFHFNKGE